MPANTTANATPIFASTPIFGLVQQITAADTTRGADLSGANVRLLLTAGTDGAIFNYVRFFPLGTNIATMARLFLNNGGALNVASNNVLVGEIAFTATTASDNLAQFVSDWALNMPVPAGYRLYVTLGTTVAAGYAVSAVGMNF